MSFQFLPNLDNSFLSLSVSDSSASNNNSLGIMTTASGGSDSSSTLLGSSSNSSANNSLSEDAQVVAQLVQEGKNKIAELRNGMKAVEAGAARLNAHASRAHAEVSKTFSLITTLLDERRSEVLRELESSHSTKQMALSVQMQRAQDTMEKIASVCDYVDQLAKSPSAVDLGMYKKAVEQRLHEVLSAHHEASLSAGLNPDDAIDFDFVGPSYATAQAGVKNAFGYVRTRSDSGNSTNSGSGAVAGSGQVPVATSNGSGSKQPPISRPVNSNIGSLCNGGGALGLSPMMSGATANGGGGLAAGILAGGSTSFNGTSGSSLHGLLDRHGAKSHQTPPAAGGGFGGFQGDQDIFAKRNGFLPRGGGIGDMVNGVNNPYEKWSDGGSNGSGLVSSKLLFGANGPSDPASVAAAAAQAAVAAAQQHAANAQMAVLSK